MKLLHKKIEKDGKGSISLLAQEDEDMWHVYNLVQIGDRIRALTFRNVKTTGPTGSVKSEKVRVMITVEVSGIDFDTKSSQIRISGKNCEESKHIKMGAYHTLELALHRKFSIMKDTWDAMHLERIDMATDPSKTADLAAIVLQEGHALICLITSYTTLVRAKVSVVVPRKRTGSETRHGRALDRFYQGIYDAIVRHIDFSIVKCVIVASPGFYNEECIKRILALAQKQGNKSIINSRSKFLPRHASSGHLQALREVLADPSCSDLIKTTKAYEEVKALERFYEKMSTNPDQAFYGYNDVKEANDAKAIHELLVSDSLFRSQDIATRKKYVQLVEESRENGAKIRIFSSLHVSGQQLDQLSGVAALLRFPLILDQDLEQSHQPNESKGEGKLNSGRKKKKKRRGTKKQDKKDVGDIDDFEHDSSFLGDF
mmetsp:Transcript_9480/g.17308  ORF Transcript_9480/g.17308 Transcript_9480/m.17308 type:complete len:429 (-) Transcript_9480:135-1421(-)